MANRLPKALGELLENEKIQFMSELEQFDLLQLVKQAQAKLSTAKLLFEATDRQVGIDMATLMPGHKLVSECWKMAMLYRQSKSE
ncbi:DUF2605 family protein [Anabaena sphaerica]|uniref:DUF2605 family protein n=1 Tax=Anabaena sphaerica TaxID=212446 RepID=UPI003BB1D118